MDFIHDEHFWDTFCQIRRNILNSVDSSLIPTSSNKRFKIVHVKNIEEIMIFWQYILNIYILNY